MATSKQIAARKLFAKRAKAGTLKKNPVKRKTVSAKQYVSRPSQITGTKPTKRLKARRAVAVKAPKRGYFPNPVQSSLPFQVQVYLSSKTWDTISCFRSEVAATQYARALNSLGKYAAVRIWKK